MNKGVWLYERLLLSTDKEKVKEIAQRGQIIERPQDVVKDPLVLEFLGLQRNRNIQKPSLKHALLSIFKSSLWRWGNGYDGTSVEQIASIVGIKAPSLYKHYKGKEDILNTLIDSAEERYEEMFGSERNIGKVPQNCISQDGVPFQIEQDHCLHCGNCLTACPVDAVVRR